MKKAINDLIEKYRQMIKDFKGDKKGKNFIQCRAIDLNITTLKLVIQDLEKSLQSIKPITDNEIRQAADKALELTKLPPNPKTTERERELGKLAYINGAKWMQSKGEGEKKEKCIECHKQINKGIICNDCKE